METLRQDVRHAWRSLRRQPGFALSTIGVLAIGIGATAAIFTIVNAVILRPLPFPESDRMVAVLNRFTNTGVQSPSISAPDFHDWVEQSRSFEALAYYSGGEASVGVAGQAEYAVAFRTTPGFFETLGTQARLGRLPGDEEQRAGGPLTAVVTDAFWRRRLGASPSAIGTPLTLGERTYEVIGVLPPDMRFPERADVYYPAWVVPETTSRSAHNYRVIGRLKSDVTLAQANDEMTSITRRLEQQYPLSNGSKLAVVVPLQEHMVGATRTTLFVLLAAVATVLLVACANVANLLLARATLRSREMAVRAAMGAGRGRLARQLLTESLVLALLAGVAGAVLGALGLQALLAIAPQDLPRLDEVRIDATALAVALAVAALSSVVFGYVPALHTSKARLAAALMQGGKGSAMGSGSHRMLSAFVVAEIALAVVLVFGAGLLGRSLLALSAVDMGFDRAQLLVMRTSVPLARFEDAPRAAAFYREVLPQLAAVPGVESIAGVTSLPTAVRSNGGYWIEGGPGPEVLGMKSPQAIFTVTTPGYFHTLRVPLRSGRDFTDADRADAPLVAIVNETLAREAFPGQDAIGRRLRTGLDRPDYLTIVGVTADVRTYGPARPAQAEIYMPVEQHAAVGSALVLVARTTVPAPLTLVDPIRRIIREKNPDVPVRAETMDATLEGASATPRFRTVVLGIFAAVGLLLSMVGIYGVMAYIVGHRVPEIGLRVALGATPRDVFALIVGQGGRLWAMGLVLGLLISLAVWRMLDGLLFGVSASDPLVLAGVIGGITVSALAACYLPVRRALAVEPAMALRTE